VHLFSGGAPQRLEESKEHLEESKNKTSMFYAFSSILPSYFSKEFSFARFRVPDDSTSQICLVAESTLYVVTKNDMFYSMSVKEGELCASSSIHMGSQRI